MCSLVKVPPWPKEITWYNKEGRVETNEKYRTMADGLGTYSIEILSTEAMDEGEWKCVATNADNAKQFTTCFIAMSSKIFVALRAMLTKVLMIIVF